jgi:hypothetical protein
VTGIVQDKAQHIFPVPLQRRSDSGHGKLWKGDWLNYEICGVNTLQEIISLQMWHECFI